MSVCVIYINILHLEKQIANRPTRWAAAVSFYLQQIDPLVKAATLLGPHLCEQRERESR